ncbi:hypothetical protein BJX70DRAFT_248682 [Aspergillus crustosus]
MAPRYALADSESESEPNESDTPPQPLDKELERALRDAVAKIYQSGKMENLTVKRVRIAAEKELQLEEGFYKSNGDWKSRSDQIIKDEVEVQDAAAQELKKEEEEDQASPLSTTKPAKRAKSNSSATARKRRKTSPESDVGSVLDVDSVEKTTKSTESKARPKKVVPDLAEEIISDDLESGEEQSSGSPKRPTKIVDHSESEMSVVLDEEPKPKRQRQKKSAGTASVKAKKAPAKAKDADADPIQAEIKRLQGWLIKCGIRKMWARELAPFETPKAKVKHLKDMLKGAGMDGRFSLEKARQIKEERELREDLEIVQEGAKRWGNETAEDGSDDGQPRRRLNRGRQALAFLESDGEETD